MAISSSNDVKSVIRFQPPVKVQIKFSIDDELLSEGERSEFFTVSCPLDEYEREIT